MLSSSGAQPACTHTAATADGNAAKQAGVSVGHSCPRAGLDALLAKVGGTRRRVRRGEYLIRCGAPFLSVFGVHAGSFKTVLVTEDGREQVIGHHMAGEILGLESVGGDSCCADAAALEDSEVVEVPFAELDSLALRDPSLQRELFRLLAAEIQRERGLMLLLGSMRAEERLAAYLLNLSGRLAAQGWSATHFILRMTREEIGSLLGLKLETVSRILSRFQAEGLISVRSREISIADLPGLKAVIGRTETRREPVN